MLIKFTCNIDVESNSSNDFDLQANLTERSNDNFNYNDLDNQFFNEILSNSYD